MWRVDVKGMKAYWSDVVCDIHGVPHGTIVDVSTGVNYYRGGFSGHGR